MELNRTKAVAYVALATVWLLIAAWQVHEHSRVREAARTALRNRSLTIADTLGALIRGLRFRGTILQDRLDPVLQEMVSASKNDLSQSAELLSVVLLNAANEPVAAAGRKIDLQQPEVMQKGERWGTETLTIINPVDLGAILTEGETNPTVVLPPITNSMRMEPPRGQERDRPPDDRRPPPPNSTNLVEAGTNRRPPSSESEFRRGSRRPPWLRNMPQEEYQSLLKNRALHGLVLMLSTESAQTAVRRDIQMRLFIMLMATLSVAGIAIALRNVAKTSELQIRLVRASELNTHLKEMNLAAAGLAHETRNPLNIIRGLAHLISKEPPATPELMQRSKDIINEVDKVAAQLNEFINYSRPREVRRVAVPLKAVFAEITRALAYDIDEKRIQISGGDDGLIISADEQLLRQALFNLLINAVQAVDNGGAIELVARKETGGNVAIEIRDNGPGVPQDRRKEIFKPYVTAQKGGTGLGLAVCQQIVLAHGWEIECLPNEPKGAIFRISHIPPA